MTIHTSRQLKDLVRNLAASSGVEAHVLIRRYMMERLLERLPDAEAILRAVENSPELQRLWDEYRRKNRYSEACTWERVMRSLWSLCARAGLPTEAR